MKKIIKAICFLLLLTMLEPTIVIKANPMEKDVGEEITLQYVNSSYVNASISINGGEATCKSTCSMINNCPSTISMVLQKSKDKKNYTPVANWNKVYGGTGKKSLSGTESVSKGYYYRVKTVVRVFSESGGCIETITVYSNVKLY